MVKFTTEHLEYMGIPRTHWCAQLDKIPDTCKHKPKFRQYVDDIRKNVWRPKGLFLFGEYSQGKSACAAICLKAAAQEDIFGYWLFAKTLPTHIIKETMSNDGMTVYERCLTAPLLVIDELQIREDIRYTETSIEDLIRLRVDDCLCTIITSNIGMNFLTQKYPSLGAVLCEAVVPLKIDGYDFRQRIREDLLL